MQHYHVTAENIDVVRESGLPIDQRKELEPGCETWGIKYEGGQRGQITAWPHRGSAAICLGGDSIWGIWDPNARTIITDDQDEDGRAIVYGENGDRIPADPDCD